MGKLKFIGDFTLHEKNFLEKELQVSRAELGELVLSRLDHPTSLKSNLGFHLQYDFDNNRVDYKRNQIGKKEPLARALGIEKGIQKVVDLSMGLAIDSVLLSQIGFRVVSVERNALLNFLAIEGQKLSSRDEIKSIEFVHSEAIRYLETKKLDMETSIYFDPMFPEKKKSALPRQEMQFFKKIVGSDDDASLVLKTALEMNINRVVVKRPLKAEPLWGKPNHELKTKLVRYDVYMKRVSGK